jgi:hypothetical protein
MAATAKKPRVATNDAEAIIGVSPTPRDMREGLNLRELVER